MYSKTRIKKLIAEVAELQDPTIIELQAEINELQDSKVDSLVIILQDKVKAIEDRIKVIEDKIKTK